MALSFSLVMAALSAVPLVEVKSGFTLNTGLFVAILTALAAILRVLITNQSALRKIDNESDASLRKDLLGEVRALRKEVADERAACEARINELSKAYKSRVDHLEGELTGLRRQMIQWQQSSGAAMPLSDPEIDQIIRKLDGGEK